MDESGGTMTRLFGIAASPGVAIGRVYLLDRRKVKTPKQHIPPEEVEKEIRRFEAALRESDQQLERIKQKLKEREGEEHFQILEAHQLILHDEHLVEPTRRIIRDERVNAEWALRKAVEAIKGLFDTVDDQYFRERRSDVDFVGDRIIRNLLGVEEHAVFQPPPDAVVVTHDLSPADTALLHRHAVLAFLTDAGGKTSHTAILARAFELPAVVGLDDITQRVGNGDLVIVDGIRGEVILDPPADVVAQYRARARRYAAFEAELMLNRDLPAETKDGMRVHLHANVELMDEIEPSVKHGAEGIGLYRTEFLYMNRTTLPLEEEHLDYARQVLGRMAGKVITFRTFDLGGDKLGLVPGPSGEMNPALGLRSIRLCLKERPLFKVQLRALLRAAAEGSLRIMFPMVSGVDELREARAVVEEARGELELEGLRHGYPPIGVMVEMPSAALCADLLAKDCDFFSIGTNDLIQYALAIDRGNEHVSYLYRPLHPAILRLIRNTIRAGHDAGIPVAMCGEMAGEPLFALVLVGLGLDELSMNPTAIPIVKSVLRSSTASEARALAEEVMRKATVGEIERVVWETMSARFPEHILKGDAPGDTEPPTTVVRSTPIPRTRPKN
ncbi:MAG TPA: phosphoenolpyruvate--protein phosphotransferase [Polyangia bacterium]|nr:phosphoenolpyruvate--protein phosphotransferase [Polyangia bacterium]